jgi:hypothetical protein
VTVRFHSLGRFAVLVLDRALLAEHQVEPGTPFRLEIADGRLTMNRLEEEPGDEPEWNFEAAQGWVTTQYATAFRVLAR